MDGLIDVLNENDEIIVTMCVSHFNDAVTSHYLTGCINCDCFQLIDRVEYKAGHPGLQIAENMLYCILTQYCSICQPQPKTASIEEALANLSQN